MVNQTETTLRERERASASSKPRRAERLTSHWSTDPSGKLVIRWAVEAEPDEHCLPDALAA
jgi:hypothetical protein